MNKKRKRITDDQLQPEEMEALFENTIRAKFDAELRQDLENTLRQEYRIVKGAQQRKPTETRGKQPLFLLAAVAASLAVLILAWTVFRPSPASAQELALAYLATSEIYHSGALKGNTEGEDVRQQAIRAFNAEAYAQAVQYFERIEEPTEEDLFYSGIAYLHQKKYADAITKLTSLNSMDSNYRAEANWYRAIAYILSGNRAAAKALLAEMEPASWNYDKSRQLLQALE